nr:hypothetical protein XfCFBP8356_07420 [Xylella fastidiosa subsp. sandyi]
MTEHVAANVFGVERLAGVSPAPHGALFIKRRAHFLDAFDIFAELISVYSVTVVKNSSLGRQALRFPIPRVRMNS